MTIVNLILSAIIVFAGIVVGLLIRKNNAYRRKAREATSDLYKIKTDSSPIYKVFNLNKSVFGALHKTLRKSPVLAAAEQFKKKFELGRFVIFCSDRNTLLPLMGVGFKLRIIEGLKIDFIKKLLAERESSGQTGEGLPLGVGSYESIAQIAKLPNQLRQPFIYYYKFNNQIILFVGEDSKGELAHYCTITDFDKAIWPLLYDICRSNYSIKKHQEKARALQVDLNQAKSELMEMNRNIKHKAIDVHAFYDISNKMFTIYDGQRLIESFVESIRGILNPARTIVMTRQAENGANFKVAASAGKVPRGIRAMELSAESGVIKLLASQKRAMMLPVLSSGMPENDPFVEKALAHGFSSMEKLMVGGDMCGIVLVSNKRGEKPYDDSEMEIFSTLANMASLALDNIHQYSLIEKMSYTDYVTELYNYRYFYKRLKEEIYRAKRFDRMLALVIFDIDNFKAFNDTYGHQAGDEVLRNLSRLVTKSVRAIDIVSRYGGEEFCIIMPDTGFANCLIFIERLRKKIEEHKFTSKFVDEGYKITVSIGGAIYAIDAQAPDRLIYSADMALLKAKGDGRNRSIMFNSLMLEDEELLKSSQQQLTDMGIYEDL
ncbi:MAG: sensor domain-containing diguanylate cyclase [candidate division Zixibacteria bacterium]|nr:sensor domain-containing diguanylate cyclase [candidate division Zixibacteria bacterium]